MLKRRKRRPPPPTRLPISELDKKMMKIHQINLNKPEAYAVRILRLQRQKGLQRRCTCIECRFVCQGQQSWARHVRRLHKGRHPIPYEFMKYYRKGWITLPPWIEL
ncbi:uncharacterized protein LOC134196141 [Corticium candelabrum]|uniref:uncharacterized protein LOC134196141 n=1 Tax=Corticium candelabrum TaxID=121492 RepID=UPI002E268CFE|nr:uncharacterized protein LOC134196141 [Corticium candelabrum]